MGSIPFPVQPRPRLPRLPGPLLQFIPSRTLATAVGKASRWSSLPSSEREAWKVLGVDEIAWPLGKKSGKMAEKSGKA